MLRQVRICSGGVLNTNYEFWTRIRQLAPFAAWLFYSELNFRLSFDKSVRQKSIYFCALEQMVDEIDSWCGFNERKCNYHIKWNLSFFYIRGHIVQLLFNWNVADMLRRRGRAETKHFNEVIK